MQTGKSACPPLPAGNRVKPFGRAIIAPRSIS
jgi:hypothetical protein